MNTTRRSFFARLAGAGASIIAAPLAALVPLPKTVVTDDCETDDVEDVGVLPNGDKIHHRILRSSRTIKYSDGSVTYIGGRDKFVNIVKTVS